MMNHNNDCHKHFYNYATTCKVISVEDDPQAYIELNKKIIMLTIFSHLFFLSYSHKKKNKTKENKI